MSSILKGGKLGIGPNTFLHNKFLLYFFLIVSLLDLFYLMNSKEYFSIAIFVLVALVTTFFSKNMMIVMFIAITLTHIIRLGGKATTEGFSELEGLHEMEGYDDRYEGFEEGAKGSRGSKGKKNRPQVQQQENREGYEDRYEGYEDRYEGYEDRYEGFEDRTNEGFEEGAQQQLSASPVEEKKKKIHEDMQQFINAQDQIIGKMGEIEKLTQQAESFITKYQNYSDYK